jgi:hypothetical protein
LFLIGACANDSFNKAFQQEQACQGELLHQQQVQKQQVGAFPFSWMPLVAKLVVFHLRRVSRYSYYMTFFLFSL